MQGDFIPLWGIWLGESLESSLPDLLPSASAPLLLWKPPGCSQVTFAALSLGSCISSGVASPVGSSSLSSHGPHTDHTVIAHWSSSGCLSLCFGVWHSATGCHWVGGWRRPSDWHYMSQGSLWSVLISLCLWLSHIFCVHLYFCQPHLLKHFTLSPSGLY